MKRNKLPNLITVLILTLITVVMWISLDVYRALSKKPSPSVPQNISAPLTPTLDTQSLNQIQSRIFLDDSQIPDVIVTKATSLPTPKATSTPLASPSEVPTPTPIASPESTP